MRRIRGRGGGPGGRCLLACLGFVALFVFFSFCGLVFDKLAIRKYDNKLVEMMG